MFRPLLEYASPIFGDQSISNDHKLDQIQAQAALVCSGALFNTNRERLLSEMGWAELAQRRNICKASLVFKCLHDLCPAYLSNIYIPQIPVDNSRYDLRGSLKLNVPRCKTERYRRSFIPSSIRL